MAQHNLGETLTAPTPLTWELIGHFMNRGGFIQLYRDLGFVPSKRVIQDGFLELICGKVTRAGLGLRNFFTMIIRSIMT